MVKEKKAGKDRLPLGEIQYKLWLLELPLSSSNHIKLLVSF